RCARPAPPACVAEFADPVLKDRIAARAEDALNRFGPAITSQTLKTFARAARKGMRTESGYRRDHLRALAQRIEVDAKEVRIMGSKSVLLVPSSPPRARKQRVFACPVLYRSGALGEIRTPDPQIRSLVLYPAELRALTAAP